MRIVCMLSKEQKSFFVENGFLVVDGLFDNQDIVAYQSSFRSVVERIYLEAGLPCVDVKAKTIHQLLIDLYKQSSRNITLVQRLASRLPEFFRLSSNRNLIHIIKALLFKNFDSALYTISNIVIFDFSEKIRNHNRAETANFHTKWHTDIFWTIPNSKYMHIWIPLLHSVTPELGQLEICPGSHKKGLSNSHQFDPKAPYNYRYFLSEETLQQYSPISIDVKLGQVLLFDNHLIHRSGTNLSNSLVRSTMIGLYHDANQKDFVPGVPSLKFANKTPEQWFYELYQNESVKPYLKEQLHESDTPPTGI